METGSVFKTNRTQAVRLPKGSRFPENVKKVIVRVVGQDRIRIRQSQWVGPFPAQETPSLYVYALFARHLVEGGAFDLQAEFLLPDGSSYQKRILPVSAEGGDKAMVMRRDLSPRMTRLSAPQELGILKQVMPSEDVARLTPAWTDYVAVPLPVSGTWITKHNLYGEWTVAITLKRGRTVLAEQNQTFEILP